MKNWLKNLAGKLSALKRAIVADDDDSLLMDLRDQLLTIDDRLEFWNQERRRVEDQLRQAQARQTLKVQS